MNKFTKNDFYFSVVTGITAGFLLWKVSDFLGILKINEVIPFISFEISYAWLIIVLPLVWIAGVKLGTFLGRFFIFFAQFGRFSAIGFTNFAVDLGVFNGFIALTAVSTGFLPGIFKAVSFLMAVIHSYFWNKYWAFGAENKMNRQEIINFFSVAAASWIVNVGITTGVINFINPVYGLTPERWANVGAVAGAALGLIISFVGFKIIVFKK